MIGLSSRAFAERSVARHAVVPGGASGGAGDDDSAGSGGGGGLDSDSDGDLDADVRGGPAP